MIKKKLFIALLLTGLVFGATYIINTLSPPVLSINILDESFDPLTTNVRLNNVRLVATGEGGKIYTGRGRHGENVFKISGPFIKSTEIKVNAGLFESKSTSTELTSMTVEDILAETFGGTKIVVSKLKSFPKQQAIIGYVIVDEVLKNDSYPSLLVYSQAMGHWEDISETYVGNRQLYNIDPVVLKYFSEVTTD